MTDTLGYFPVGAIIVNDDEAITYVTISNNDEQDKGQSPSTEVITTTPNHPFYLEAQVDSAKRPKLTDHVGLIDRWVGAGDLKVGDQLKQADGTVGTVTGVQTVTQPKQMYNLSVGVAHTHKLHLV